MAKVLILDDDEAIVEGLTMALNDEGIGVVGTTSPFQLPFLLRRERPDVVLIDLAMPALRGERVFEALSSTLRGEIRFLVFSGCAVTDLPAIAAEVGADDFIHKGDDFGAIVRRIQFWAEDARGDRASRLEPHVAVITGSRLSEAAAVLRAGGYFVTMHPPGELPSPDADAIVIDAPRDEAQRTWRSLTNTMVSPSPVIVVTNMAVLFFPALTIGPRAVPDNLVSVVDGALAQASRSVPAHCFA
jgi:CheY-like chemotaxis protein